MKIGFCGPSRSGKTTLAKMVASELGWEFRESPVEKLVAGFNLEYGRDQTRIQELLFEHFFGREHSAPDPCVFDRTVADVIAYNHTSPDALELYERMFSTLSPLDLVFVCDKIEVGDKTTVDGPFCNFYLAALAYYGDVVAVRPGMIEDRVEFVLNTVSNFKERFLEGL